jgi:GNAT superfamily N-acetyltransferase
LVALLKELFTQEADFSFDAAKQERGLRLIIGKPDSGRIFVLRDRGQVVGMVNLLHVISTAEGGPALLVEDMVVSKSHRGKGYGSALIKQAIAYASGSGFKRMTLLTDRGNTAAQEFYHRHGFQLSKMIPMRLNMIRTF